MNKQEEKNLQIIIAKQEAESTKKLLQSFDKISKKNYKKWMVAASFVAFISIIGFWIFNNNPSSDELFSQYFSPYENVIQPISRADKSKDIKTIAFENYELGNYTDALLNFDSLLSNYYNNKDKEIIIFYKAIIHLELNQPKKAILLLKENLQQNLKWRDKNEWYLALAYLKTNNIVEAKKVLLSLSQLENNFKEKETLLLLKSLRQPNSK